MSVVGHDKLLFHERYAVGVLVMMSDINDTSPYHEAYAHFKPEEAHSTFLRNTNKHPPAPHGVKIQNTVKRIFTLV